MRKHYFLSLPLVACLLLVSLFLQNCGGSANLSIEGEEEPTEIIEQEEGLQGRRKRARIEQVDSGLEIIEVQQEPLQEVSNTFNILPPEIWQEVFSHLDFEGILAARSVSADWNELITGYRQAGIIGVENRPNHIINTDAWTIKREINFRKGKLRKLTPETIPSFAFYLLIGKVRNLPQAFWPYLQRTNVRTLDLSNDKIEDADMIELAKVLPYTQIYTLNLSNNRIKDADMIAFFRVLPQTQIHILDLCDNDIDDKGIIELAKVLPQTQIDTLYLDYNVIKYEDIVGLAKILPQTQIYILNLCGNEIGDKGITELAKVLPQTRIYTLDLSGNQIGEETEVLLKEQYPNINIITN
ncbi:MAG: F-box-like domain-containing protein [Candidatus Amoebophilus sp.]